MSGILELFLHLGEGPAFIKAVCYTMYANWPMLPLIFLEVKVNMDLVYVGTKRGVPLFSWQRDWWGECWLLSVVGFGVCAHWL
jgi:hypothetical protein